MENSTLICNQLPTHHQLSLLLSQSKKKDSSNYRTRTRGAAAPPAAGGKQQEKTEKKKLQEEIEQQEEKDHSHEQRRDNRFSDNEILNENDDKAAFSSSAAVYPNKKTAAMILHQQEQEQQENSTLTRRVTTTKLKGDQHDVRGVPPLYGTRKKKSTTTLDTATTGNHLRGRRQEEQQRDLFFSQQASRERSIDSAGGHHCRRGTEEDRDEQESYHHATRTPSTASSIDSYVVGDDGGNVPLTQREVDSSSKRKCISTSRLLPPFLVPEKSFLISSMKQRQNKLAPSNKEHKLLRSPQDDDASSITRDNSLAKHYMTSTFSSFGGSSSHSICSSTKSFTSYSSSYSSSFGRFQRSEEKVADDEKRNDGTSQQRQSHPPGACIVPKNRTGPSTSDKFFASRYACALQDVLVQENYPRSRNKVEKDLIHTDIDRRERPEKCPPSIHDRLARTKTKSMDLRLQMEMDAKKQKERERQGSRGRPAFYLVANSSSSNLNSNTPNQKSPSVRTRSASPRKHFYTYLTETETISSAYRKGLATPQKKSPSTAGQKMSSRDMKALCSRLANQDTIASSKRIVPTPNRAPMLTTYEKMRQAEEEKKKRVKPKVGKDFFDILAVEKTQSMLFREIDIMKSGSFRE